MDIVIGAAFGDEGKGLITHHLASRYGREAIVVRFNGGAQAGHTVETHDAKRHVFRHIGSGTFTNATTYLSQFFVVNPILFLEEMQELQQLGHQPIVYVDPACVVTTPYDMIINQMVEESRGAQRHGSCGVGFAETIERNQHAKYSLTVADLEHTDKVKTIVHAIRQHWLPQRLQTLKVGKISEQWQHFIDSDDIFSFFVSNIQAFLQSVTTTQLALTTLSRPLIFEGAQGLMLDQDHGWFPHVTRSHTGLKNVLALIQHKPDCKLNVIYVTRSYLTRHGAGPLPHELPEPPYERISDKTNIPNTYQGALRYAWLNVPLLKLFIQRDLSMVPSIMKVNHQLAMTCLDQVEEQISYINDDKKHTASPSALLKKLSTELQTSLILCSTGPTKAHVREWRP